MNENEFDLAARAWLEDGPNRMSDRALLSALEEIHATRQRRAAWRGWRATPASTARLRRPTLQRLSMAVATGVAAIALVAVASVLLSNLSRGIEGPVAASPTSAPSASATSGGMWPQSNLEEVRAAQARVDAGYLDYSSQVGARVAGEDTQVQIGLVGRFLREVLGWESSMFLEGGRFSDWAGTTDGWVEGTVTGQRYLRCAPGGTNPLYPSESCAPTLDDLHYETVSLDLAQPDRQGRDGIWVVSGWRLMTPFAQADPAAVEGRVRERLEAFLAARVAGSGAEGYVEVEGDEDVPLLYATTSGAPYERYEIRLVAGPWWPDGGMTFSVRLLADSGATAVEQQIVWVPSLRQLWLDAKPTTENGRPVPLSFGSSDGEVTFSAPSTWKSFFPGKDPTAWFGILWRDDKPYHESGERIELVDPVAYDQWCWGRSLPEGADALAQMVRADPNLDTTAPKQVRIGGLEAVSMDVALAPGGSLCQRQEIEIARWIHVLRPESGLRLRLYLVDLPEGMSPRTLAITVVAPEERFEAYLAETAPIIESIGFHPGAAPPSQPGVP